MIGQTLGHYEIVEQIGAGGMGVVYRAHDSRLGRDVALKVLLPGTAAKDVSRERLRKEALALSRLSHPNIAQVFDFDGQGSVDFLVMEFVKGTTLALKLREGSVPEETAIAWGIQIASAMEHAAEAGIVHRDLKPGNIMITPKGVIKVLDFGLAMMLRMPEDDLTESIASSSDAAGTMPYMAPEQLKGGKADFRSDIYSLGALLYESVTGRRLFSASGTVSLIVEILNNTPVPPRQLNSKLSPTFEAVILRCLAKEPDRRYQHAPEVRAALESIQGGQIESRNNLSFRESRTRKIASIGLLVLVTIGLAMFLIGRPSVRVAKVDAFGPAELAILPLRMPNNDGEQEAFGDGLVETLTSRLSQLSKNHSLQVVPASEIRENNVTTLQEANRRFGATLGLELNVQHSGDLIRVNYALVDAKRHRQLHGDTITSPASDPFGLEDKVADSVLNALQIELKPEERKALEEHGTTKPNAYDYYLQGRGYLQDFQKPENTDSAIAEFDHALEQDPNYASAFSGLGEAYWRKFKITKDNRWVDRAKSACERAIKLQDANATGHACLGTVFTGTGAYEQAVEQFKLAAELQPTDDIAYKGLAFAYERLGRPEQAEETFKKAISLRPNYWANYNWLGELYLRQGNFEGAKSMFSEVIRLTPDSYIGYGNLGITFLVAGQYTEAVPELERSVSIQPTAENTSNLGVLYFQLRRFSEAARIGEKAVKLDGNNNEVWGNLGEAYYWSPGERSKATSAFATAIKLGNDQIAVNPRNANLLSDIAEYYSMVGERKPAIDHLNRALAIAPQDRDVLFNGALVYNQLGKKEECLAYLAKAVAVGLPASMLRDTPNLDDLHGDERFQRLISKAQSMQEIHK
jgi:serine/threonine protein kinase/tetratricopeptide (TPR) repeat protein